MVSEDKTNPKIETFNLEASREKYNSWDWEEGPKWLFSYDNI